MVGSRSNSQIITGQIGWFGWVVVVVKNRTKYRSDMNMKELLEAVGAGIAMFIGVAIIVIVIGISGIADGSHDKCSNAVRAILK